jgi:CBS domain-containing protein
MDIGLLCVREVDTLPPQATALDAAKRMRERGVGTLVVVNEQRHPMGLVSDRDLTLRVMARAHDAASTPIVDVMSPMSTTVLDSSSIESALAQMRIGRMRRLPVVNGKGTLVGIVALDDILAVLAREFSLVGGLVEAEAPHGPTKPL